MENNIEITDAFKEMQKGLVYLSRNGNKYGDITVIDDLIQGVLGNLFVYMTSGKIIDGASTQTTEVTKLFQLSNIIAHFTFPKDCRIVEFLKGYDPEIYKLIQFYD